MSADRTDKHQEIGIAAFHKMLAAITSRGWVDSAEYEGDQCAGIIKFRPKTNDGRISDQAIAVNSAVTVGDHPLALFTFSNAWVGGPGGVNMDTIDAAFDESRTTFDMARGKIIRELELSISKTFEPTKAMASAV